MSMRRFTRFQEGAQAAVAMHLAHYNLVRLHKILRVAPAVPAGERLGAAVRAGGE